MRPTSTSTSRATIAWRCPSAPSGSRRRSGPACDSVEDLRHAARKAGNSAPFLHRVAFAQPSDGRVRRRSPSRHRRRTPNTAPSPAVHRDRHRHDGTRHRFRHRHLQRGGRCVQQCRDLVNAAGDAGIGRGARACQGHPCERVAPSCLASCRPSDGTSPAMKTGSVERPSR